MQHSVALYFMRLCTLFVLSKGLFFPKQGGFMITFFIKQKLFLSHDMIFDGTQQPSHLGYIGAAGMTQAVRAVQTQAKCLSS